MKARRGFWPLFGALGVVLLSTAQPALGHATLIETSPVDGATLETAPDEVRVAFDEGVTAPVAAVRVFDSGGSRVDAGDAATTADSDEIIVALDSDLPHDVYVATWRAVSLDGHPIRGAFVFQVGDGQRPVDDSLIGAVLGEGKETAAAASGLVSRWVGYLASLAAVGATVFVLLARSEVPGGVTKAIRWSAGVGIIASVFQIPAFAAEATGLGLESLVSSRAMADAATSPIGVASLVRVAGLGVVLFAARRSILPAWAWIGAGVAVISELLAGHTLTTPPAPLVLGADLVHVAAAAVWLGGLMALAVSLRHFRRTGEVSRAARLVVRFSTVATWSLAALVAAGVALAWTQVRSLQALTSTHYGWSLVAKAVLALFVIGVGSYNKRALVPAVAVRKENATAWARLTRTLRAEVLGIALVLGVTAALVNIQPAAEAAGVIGPYSTYLPFGDGQVNLVVDPNRVGVNEIHAYVLGEIGALADVSGEAVLEMSLPSEDLGPIVRSPNVAGPGHWVHTGPDLALPGTWEITFRLTSGFDEHTATAEVAVNE